MKRISVGGSIARYAMAAFSNRRLIAADDGGVSFRWKAYRVEGPGRWKTMTLSPAEFIRRFLVYVLPKGFHRIRHYGLFANGNRTESIAKARELLAVAPLPPKPEPATASADEPVHALIWALTHVLFLQLEQRPLTLFMCDRGLAEKCTALIAGHNAGHNLVERMAVRLLGTVRKPQPQACVKGRFFDRMQAKLEQLATHDSNELVRIDVQAMANALAGNNEIGIGFRRDIARGT